MKNFDIVVIGAGPGGSIAAKVAAENGYSTCLIEKEKLNEGGRYKACGGAIAWDLIKDIDYPEDKISRIIESLELHHLDGKIYSKRGKGAVVWRSTFDNFLTNIATNSGALLKDYESMVNIKKVGNKYQIITEKGKYTTKYVIAADGVTSSVLKLLKWPFFRKEDILLTINQEMKTSRHYIDKVLGKDSLHLFFGIKTIIPIGYAWLFPKKETITLGWGSQINLIKNSRKEFKKFLTIPFVKQVLKNSKLEIFKPHLIPVGLRPILYSDNVFAIGDAGGFVDPISGKGIPYAMKSGNIAIESINTCEKKNTPNRLGNIYEKSLDKKFLKILKLKRTARDEIYKSDETLKKFLSLWEKYSSSEIVLRKLI